MKSPIACLFLALAAPAYSNGGLTVSGLPAGAPASSPVCHDSGGRLAPCAVGAIVDPRFQAPLVEDADGQFIGTLVGVDLENSVEHITRSYVYSLVSPEGYFFSFPTYNSPVAHGMFWAGADCTGDAYLQSYPIAFNNGPMVFQFEDDLYFIEGETETIEIVTLSRATTQYPDCVNETSPFARNLYPVYPNDPFLTGVEDAIDVAFPIKVIRPD